MTTLEIILIITLWISYGVFNAYQHDWFEGYEINYFCTFITILFAPIALVIRIFRGIFIWKGEYH